MLGLSVVPAMLQFLGFLFLPESPRWLIQKGLTQKARRVLSQIRGNQNIDEEYDTIKSSIEEEEKDCGEGEITHWVFHTLAHSSSMYKNKHSIGSLNMESTQEVLIYNLTAMAEWHNFVNLNWSLATSSNTSDAEGVRKWACPATWQG